MIGGDHWNLLLAGQTKGVEAQYIGDSDVKKVGLESCKALTRCSPQAGGAAVIAGVFVACLAFLNQSSRMGERGGFGGGRKDKHLNAIVFQLFDQSVQGQRNAINDIVVDTREDGQPQGRMRAVRLGGGTVQYRSPESVWASGSPLGLDGTKHADALAIHLMGCPNICCGAQDICQ